MPRDTDTHEPWLQARRRRTRINLAEDGLTPPGAGRLPLPKQFSLAPRPELFEALSIQLSRYLGVPTDGVLLVSGAASGLQLALRILAPTGRWALLESPTHPLLAATAEFGGTRLRRFARPPRSEFALPSAAIEERLEEERAPILISAPHSPSGRLLNDEELVELVAIAESHEVQVIAWESLLASHLPARRSYSSLAMVSPRICSIGCLGAALGLDGLRLGWLAGPPSLIAEARRWMELRLEQVSTLDAQLGLVALQRLPPLLARARSYYRENWPLIASWAETREDLRICDPGGGFQATLCLPDTVEALPLAEALFRDDSVLVAPGELFGGKGFLRISLAAPGPMLAEGLAALDRALDRALEGKH